MKKIVTLILMLVILAMANNCPNLKYEGENKLNTFTSINKWLENPRPYNEYDIIVDFTKETSINVTGFFIGETTIKGFSVAKKVIINHKFTVENGQLMRWMDRSVITFIDENGIIDHEITVNYDMPKFIYQKLCK